LKNATHLQRPGAAITPAPAGRPTAAQRLDRLPASSIHRRMAMMIGLGLFFDGFDLYMASGVMPALAAAGWADMHTNALFASAGALGALIGAFFAGWLGDRRGRKFTFQFNLALFGSMSIAAVFAPDMHWLIALRFLMGIGLGAEIVVGYATISEFVPPATRGRWGAILFFVATASLLASNLIGYVVIPHLGWRWMFAIAGAGGLLVWVMRKSMPESPRWLELVGRWQEADQILDRIEAEVIAETGKPLPPLVQTQTQTRTDIAPRFTTGDLFRPPILRSTLLAVLLNVVALSSLYGFIIWLPTFLVKQGLAVQASLGHTALISAGGLFGVFLAGLLTDRWSRKYWIVVSAIMSAVLGYAYIHAGDLQTTTAVGIVLIASLYLGTTMGWSTYVPELFPTELRLRGSGIASVAGRAVSILAPQAVAVLYDFNGVNAVVYSVIGLLIAQAVLVAVFGIQTNRRALDVQFVGTH
jgi:putative MFS transporter